MYYDVCNKHWQSKKTKISYVFKKAWTLSIVYSKCGHEYKKISKEEKSIEILKILGLVNNIKEHNRVYDHVWRKYKSRI